MRIFIDTNIILDVLAERKSFFKNSKRIWEIVEKGDAKGYISATTITDIFYIIRKHLGRDNAYGVVKKILMVFNITSVTETDVRKALNLNFKDFEDALQAVCAKKIKAEYLITRNKKDFQKGVGINIVDAEEFFNYIKI